MKFRCISVWILFFLAPMFTIAQVQVNMSDTLITACNGILFDSETGTNGVYGHNENLVLTICPPGGVDSIVMNFLSFNVEAGYDFLSIHDGPDTLSPLIGGPFSDSILPPPIVSTGCLTLHFTSDNSIAGPGWVATWEVFESIPLAANMTLSPLPATCSTTTINIAFDQMVHCDSLIGSNFALAGPLGQAINVTAQNCTNDSSDQALINFSPGLNQSGTYTLEFTTHYRDACDSLWELSNAVAFTITDCPLNVILTATPDTICPGACTDLSPLVSGGDSSSYVYLWSNGLPPTAGPHTVCPTATTTYSVTVTDGSAAPAAISSVTVQVLPPPTAMADFNICQSEPALNLTASPTGGTWSGPGILDSLAGTFLADSAGPGMHGIVYALASGCADTVIVTVDPFDAGPPEAACPGTAPFSVIGFTPSGGTWSGPFINSAGVFNPSSPGVYTITYTLAGCMDSKVITVQNLSIPGDTSYCSSADEDTLVFSPPGGVWSIGFQGNNNIFDNTAIGALDPSGADSVNVLIYSLHGCSDSLVVSVFQISAGNNITACPKQDPFISVDTIGSTITEPAGGVWSGPGLLNPTTGLFDPSLQNNNWNALMTYTVGGCSADRYIYVRITAVNVDTLTFCREDSSIFTMDFSHTGRTPSGGFWAGPNLLTTGSNATVQISDLGVGLHLFDYEVNTCSDSFFISIPPPNTLTDTSICEFEPSFQLLVDPADHLAGGTWTGTGTSPQGSFDPQTAGVGNWPIYYESYLGCRDTSQITVFPPPVVTISGLDPSYCYMDTAIGLNLMPTGGLLTGTGLSGNTFNPALAGPGTHQLTYTYGQGACTRSASIFTSVGIPLNLTLTASDDTICIGESIQLNAQGLGGNGNTYNFNWNQGLISLANHTVIPSGNSSYQVTVSDGCSDPVTDSVFIVVQQPFNLQFDSSAVQCFGELGYAVVVPSVPGNYTFVWDNDPFENSDSIHDFVGSSHQVLVSDSGSGCKQVGNISIPGYSAIRANFVPNPSDCVPFSEPYFDFIDLSTGGLYGVWDFGDGESINFSGGGNQGHYYDAVGQYLVSLALENNGQCKDTVWLEVCVEEAEPVVYGSFSPNGDGKNDYFEIDYLGAYPNNTLKVFNRYGNLIYQAAPYQNDWDGRQMGSGNPVPDGAYFFIFDKGNGAEPLARDVVIMR